MNFNTGAVQLCAEHRLPGKAPKCAVCREEVPKGARCIWIKPLNSRNSKFYMHVKCSAEVLFKFMELFNYANNGMKPPEPAKRVPDVGTVKEF